MVFGDTNKFSIEYNLLNNPYNEEGLLKESWGRFRLWVNGMNLCEYQQNGVAREYEWNLIYIVEWLCNNLEYIIGFDPFPLPVDGNNTTELIQNSDQFETDEDDEMYLWYQAKSRWIQRHSWLSNRDGSCLSSVYFRRVDNKIELTWNNDFYKEKDIFFKSSKGIELIQLTLFKEVIFMFLNDILNKFQNSIVESDNGDQNHVSGLRRIVGLLEKI